jgi:hypothetical protein
MQSDLLNWPEAFGDISLDPLLIVVSGAAAVIGLRSNRPPLAVALAAVFAGTVTAVFEPLWLIATRALAEFMWSMSILFLLGGFDAGTARGNARARGETRDSV